MKRLNKMDASYLLTERRETPMHVGGLNLFTLPEGVDEQEFLHGLADNLRSAQRLQSPFGDRLKTGPAGLLGSPYWEPDENLDIDYHIRHSALPRPGRYRELFALVSRLHGTLLDRERPLWEMHLIEGLENRQFAVYFKFHHSAVDGMRAMHLMESMYSSNPKDVVLESPLSQMANERYREMLAQKKAMREESATPRELRNMGQAFKAQFGSSLQLGKSLGRVANAWLGREDALQVSWRNVPHTPINTEVDSARRFVAQSWPFARIRNMGKALGGSFNDAVLAMCAGALRTQLLSQGDIPEQSLKALVPISLREMGDMDSSNAVGAIIADMATNIADPVKRFKAIKASMEAGKSLYKGMGSRDAMLFTGLTQAPALLMLPLGLASRFPPFSLVISNVPGSRQPMYWNGAKVEGIYPANILINGIALNITLVTYDDQVDFGITACRRSLPQAQRLIDYMEDSLVELEQAAGELSSGTHKSQGRVVKRKVGAPARKAAVSATAAKVRPKAKRTVKLKARAKAAPQLAGKAASKARAKVPAKAKAATKAKAPAKAKASAAKVGVEKGAEAPVAEVKA